MAVDTILSKIEIQDTTVRHFRAIDENQVDDYLATWMPVRIRTTQQATQRCYLMMVRPLPTPVLTAFAVCNDQLIREDEDWKFSQRIIRFG